MCQIDGDIFYEATRDIEPGDELLVWYSNDYTQFFGIPVSIDRQEETLSVDPEASEWNVLINLELKH